MKLIEIIDILDKVGDDQIIFIASNEPMQEDIEAVMHPIKQNVETGETPVGMEYFLEVSIAKEVLDVWKKWRNNRNPTLMEKYEALVYYVLKDAYIPNS